MSRSIDRAQRQTELKKKQNSKDVGEFPGHKRNQIKCQIIKCKKKIVLFEVRLKRGWV